MKKKELKRRIEQLESMASELVANLPDELASIINRLTALEQVHMALYQYYNHSSRVHVPTDYLYIPPPYTEAKNEKERT